jgi:hypothetical protein
LQRQVNKLYGYKKDVRSKRYEGLVAEGVPPDVHKLLFLADWIDEYNYFHIMNNGATAAPSGALPSLFEEIDAEYWQ